MTEVQTNSLKNTLLWLVPGSVAALALARAAVSLQSWIAKPVFSSVALGMVLALSLGALWQMIGVRPQRPLAAIVLLAAVAITSQHLFFYLDYRAAFLAAVGGQTNLAVAPHLDAKTQKQTPVPAEQQLRARQGVRELQPAGFWHYLWSQADGNQIVYWILDAAIVLYAAWLGAGGRWNFWRCTTRPALNRTHTA